MKNIYTLSCLFFSAALGIPGHSVAQSQVATVTNYVHASTTTISEAFGSASTTGNLIVVHLSWDNQSRSVTSVTDNKGNTYTSINGPTNWHTNYRSELLYAYNITGGGAPITITATLSGVSTSYFQIYISEYSGISITNPLDQHAVSIGNTAAVSSGSKTTVAGGELIYGVSIGAAGVLTTGAGFTNRSTANQNIVEDKIGTPTGSYSTTFNSAGGNWVAEMATFKPLITLPVELVSFDASVMNGNAVKLDWVTATETNNDYFELEHSQNGSDWMTVGKINGAGNSNSAIAYSATDNAAYPGLCYYRLVQFDLDGHTSYSKVLTVRSGLQPAGKIKVYPNPAVSYLTVEGDYADLQGVCVISAAGELMNGKMQVSRENDSRITINLSVLPKGVYFLKTRNQCSSFYRD